MSFGAPCETIRVSITIMTNPTIARRAFTARTMTAERESPKSNDNIGAAAGLVKASAASWTALCSSGPHGAFAQPQHIAGLVVQGYGVGTIGFDCRAHFLTDGIKINKRTIRLHQGFALLHKSATRGV
jgi:hypothetical protein